MPETIKVPRKEFRTALRVLRGPYGRRVSREAVVTSREGLLRIEVEGGGGCEIQVEGGWVGRAVVPGRVLFGLINKLPKEDPLEIWIHEGILHIGSFWTKLHPEALPPPLTETERTGLDLRTIRGLYAVLEARNPKRWYQRHIPLGVQDAEYRVMACVAKAAAILSPYGVREEDLWRLAVKSVLELGPRVR